jgi:hypothetical protein
MMCPVEVVSSSSNNKEPLLSWGECSTAVGISTVNLWSSINLTYLLDISMLVLVTTFCCDRGVSVSVLQNHGVARTFEARAMQNLAT